MLGCWQGFKKLASWTDNVVLLCQGCAQSLELALLDASAWQTISSGMAAAAARAGDQETAGAGEGLDRLDVGASVCCSCSCGWGISV
jgi:hypothetical protein